MSNTKLNTDSIVSYICLRLKCDIDIGLHVVCVWTVGRWAYSDVTTEISR